MTFPAAITGQPPQTPVEAAAGDSPRTSLRSVSLLTGLTLAQLFLQFGLQMVLARYYGAAAAMDAYVAALALPVVIATIVAGSLGYVLVPIVAERLGEQGEGAAARVASQVGLYVTALSFVIAGLVAAAAGPITAILCPGFDADKLRLTAALLAVLSLLVPLNCLIAYLNALFQAYHRFTLPAVAGVVGPLMTIAYVALFHAQQGIFAVAWGVVAGAAVTTAMLLPLLVRLTWRSASWRQPPDIATRRCLALLVPLTLGAVYWRLDPLVDRWLGSYMASGSLAHLGYAWRLVSGLMLIGTSGLSTVAFPAIAAHAAARRGTELDRELAYATRFFLFLIVPVCVGVALFAGPVVRLLFEHGRFTPADTAAVSLLVVLYVGAILGGGLGDLVSRTFYAEQDTRTPVIVSAIVFTLAVGLKVLLARPWGVAGLAAATSLYYAMNAGVLLVILARRRSTAMLAGTFKSLVRSLVGALLACGLAAVVIRWPANWSVLPAAAAGAMSYLVLMWLMGDDFAQRLRGTAILAVKSRAGSPCHRDGSPCHNARGIRSLATLRPSYFGGRRAIYVLPWRSVLYGALSCVIVFFVLLAVDRLVLGSLERFGWTAGEQWARHNKLVEENDRRKTTTDQCQLREWTGEPLPPRTATTRRILVLGDSFVWGPPYITLNHLWWRQLAIELERRGYRQVQVVAAGHPGWSTHQQLDCARRLIPEVQPDIVIWGYVTNDPDEGLVRQIFNLQDQFPLGQRARVALRRVFPNLMFKFESLRNQKLAQQYTGPKNGYAYAEWELKLLEGENFARYRQTVRDVGDLVKQIGLPTFLITLPSWPCREYFEPRYRPVLPLWEAAGVPVVSTLPAFIERYGNAPQTGPEAIRWGIDPADSHPGPQATHFYATLAVDYLIGHWPELLGSKNEEQPHELAINDWLPYELPIAGSKLAPGAPRGRPFGGAPGLGLVPAESMLTLALDYPQTTAFMPQLPLDQPTALVALRYPLPIAEIRLSGADLRRSRVWISLLHPNDPYDENDWHELVPQSGHDQTYTLPPEYASRGLAQIRFSADFSGPDCHLRLTLVRHEPRLEPKDRP